MPAAGLTAGQSCFVAAVTGFDDERLVELAPSVRERDPGLLQAETAL